MKAKVVRDGKVAVLYSPEYGAGWSTWNSGEDAKRMIFDPTIVKLVEENRHNEIKLELMKSLGYGEDVYISGGEDLKIEWIPEGTLFRISEYDGYESIRLLTEEAYFTA